MYEIGFGKAGDKKRFGLFIVCLGRDAPRNEEMPIINNYTTTIFPGDRLQVIGSDDQLATFGKALEHDVYEEDYELEKREMKLRRMVVTGTSPFLGKTLQESGIRHRYNCMVVGLEEGKENLSIVTASYLFEKGDILWVVGEEENLKQLIG